MKKQLAILLALALLLALCACGNTQSAKTNDAPAFAPLQPQVQVDAEAPVQPEEEEPAIVAEEPAVASNATPSTIGGACLGLTREEIRIYLGEPYEESPGNKDYYILPYSDRPEGFDPQGVLNPPLTMLCLEYSEGVVVSETYVFGLEEWLNEDTKRAMSDTEAYYTVLLGEPERYSSDPRMLLLTVTWHTNPVVTLSSVPIHGMSAGEATLYLIFTQN